MERDQAHCEGFPDGVQQVGDVAGLVQIDGGLSMQVLEADFDCRALHVHPAQHKLLSGRCMREYVKWRAQGSDLTQDLSRISGQQPHTGQTLTAGWTDRHTTKLSKLTAPCIGMALAGRHMHIEQLRLRLTFQGAP